MFLFGGTAVMVQVHDDRGGDHRWSQYAINGARLSRQRAATGLPTSLPHMIAAAETLAAGQDFLRVDFYEVGGQPLLGEYCLYPGSGLNPFDPDSLDEWLGAYWSAQHRHVRPALGSGEARACLPS